MAYTTYRIQYFSLACGLLLLGVNVTGVFVSLRTPAIYGEKKVLDNHGVTLTEEESLRAAERGPNESAEEYVIRLNMVVYEGIAYYWDDDGIERYNMRVPVYENYLLFLASYVAPRFYRKYEFFNQYKNLERGVGLCSLHAMVIASLLKEHGVDSKIILLDHHVVATALVDEEHDRWWVVDPSLGVVVKHDIGEIESDTDLIKPYYLEMGYSQKYVDWLSHVYGKEGNAVFSGAKEYLRWPLPFIEYVSYILKWVIPMILMAPFTIPYRSTNNQRSSPRARDEAGAA